MATSFFDNWFVLGDVPPAQQVAGSYAPEMVALSVVVAIVAAWIAMLLAGQARESTVRTNRLVALAGGALALGAGIWAMHFIGMLAFQLCAPVTYDPWLTALSMVPSVAAATVALRLLTRQSLTPVVLVISGVLTGAGIGAMHYGGMAAMDMAPNLVFDLRWFVLSVVVAVVLSTAALWIGFGLGQHRVLSAGRARLLAGVVMGTAIAGMHYTGMAAARFIGETDPAFDPEISQHITLAMAVALVAMAIAGIAVGSGVLLRMYQLTRRLADSETRYRTLISNLPGVAFRYQLGSPGKLVFVSDAIKAMTGWPASYFTGEERSFEGIMNADDLARIGPVIQQAIAVGGSYNVEYRIRRRDGQEIWVSHSAGCVRDSAGTVQWIDGVSFDITESRKRNAEFKSVATVLDSALAVLEIGTDGRILHGNAKYLAMLGYSSQDEIAGRPYEEMVPARLRQTPAFRGRLQAMLAGEVVEGEFLRLARDGRELWIQATYNPVYDENGRLQKIMAFKTDITPRKAMERELREAKVRAEQAAETRSAFLANMSHEIRTPMNAIIGFTDVLITTQLTPVQRRHLDTVRNAAQSLLRLLNDILDTAKLEKGAVELDMADFSLRSLCEQVAASMRLGAEKKGLALVLDYDYSVQEYFRGDALRIQQVLVNLVGNAIKFTLEGRVTIRVAQRQSETVVTVEDTGVGIPADRVERIFDAFAQADATVTRKFGGTGLGTTIARQLVELMGGRIVVHSEVGVGSRFEVRLPLAYGQEPVQASLPSELELPPLDILVADDVPQNIELLELLLGADGHRVRAASTGVEALQLLESQRFDVVLMDMHMPEMDGLTATREWRARERDRGLEATPVVALTASVQVADRHAALEAGMDGFATKPVSRIALEKEIARVLGLREATMPAPLARESGLQPLPDEDLVDWQQGIALWQTQERLRGAIGAFLRAHVDTPRTLQSLAAQREYVAVAALAHRVSGASGNLALRALRKSAQALETSARAGDYLACMQGVDAVVHALEAAGALVDCEVVDILGDAGDSAYIDLSPAASAAPPGLAASDRAGVRDKLAQLRRALLGNALDEASLDALSAALPAAQLRELLDAIDDFDFQRAAACVDALQAALGLEGEHST